MKNELRLIGSGVGDEGRSGFLLRLAGLGRLVQWFHGVKTRRFLAALLKVGVEIVLPL